MPVVFGCNGGVSTAIPRANRLRGDGGVFHVTHRCHNRTFLLKFARDRDAYRTKLRQHLRDFKVSLLDYCVTSNHVHLLIDAQDRLEVSGFMRMVSCWTESLAVGSVTFLEKIQPLILSRRETEIVATADNVWVLKEAPVAYGQETSPESASNGII